MRMKSMFARSYLKIVAIGSLLFFSIYIAVLRSLLSPSGDFKALEKPESKAEDSSVIKEKYLIYLEKCRIREYDHNDPEIPKKYFKEEATLCPTDAEPFVFRPEIDLASGRSCVGVDREVATESYRGQVEGWICTYREVARDSSKDAIDRHFYLGQRKPLKVGDCPNEEYIWVECERRGESRIYEQPLFLPMVKPAREPMKANNRGKKPMNVLVLGLDAVSRLMIHRQLPKTVEFLKTKENLIELLGYNKIEDNSRPNQVPLLTGIPFAAPGLESRLGQNYYDNLTRIIWDDYADRGFRTMFLEELTYYGLFDHPVTEAKGFVKVPTTYYPRPLQLAIERSDLKKKGNGFCIGTDPVAKHYLDYTFNTMNILGSNRPLFSYTWLVEATHDVINGGQRIDKYFLEFFKKMESSAILNNTAVIFISDHGLRVGEFRTTPLGRYEDMLPFGFVLLPDSYFEDNPDALKSLRVNSRRLVTVYDIYATLKELVDPWGESRTTKTRHGYSLLSNVIPGDRTCKDAGINYQFCECYESHSYIEESEVLHSFTKFVTSELNRYVLEYLGPDLCHEWAVDRVRSFARLSEGDEWTDYYKATMQMTPFGLFEMTAELKQSSQSWVLAPDIVRIDWYSPHTKCAGTRHFHSLCYCK